MNWFQVAVQVGSLLVSILVVVWNFRGAVSQFREEVIKMNTDLKADFDAKLLMFERDSDAKVGRVYERFDIYKKDVKEDYVRKDNCSLMHVGNNQSFVDIKLQLEKLTNKVDALLLRENHTKT